MSETAESGTCWRCRASRDPTANTCPHCDAPTPAVYVAQSAGPLLLIVVALIAAYVLLF